MFVGSNENAKIKLRNGNMMHNKQVYLHTYFNMDETLL